MNNQQPYLLPLQAAYGLNGFSGGLVSLGQSPAQLAAAGGQLGKLSAGLPLAAGHQSPGAGGYQNLAQEWIINIGSHLLSFTSNSKFNSNQLKHLKCLIEYERNKYDCFGNIYLPSSGLKCLMILCLQSVAQVSMCGPGQVSLPAQLQPGLMSQLSSLPLSLSGAGMYPVMTPYHHQIQQQQLSQNILAANTLHNNIPKLFTVPSVKVRVFSVQ